MLNPSLVSFLLPAVVLGVDHIITKGSKFFNKRTGEQFYIKGIAYHPGGSGYDLDPLASPKNCDRDLPYLNRLGINTLHIYEAYPDRDHDKCMNLFNDNNIYVILDLPVPKLSINREFPSYTPEIQAHFQQKIDAFSKYDNLLGFIAGNEVANNPKTTHSAAFVKASLRDAKAYVKSKSARPIPVGYADNDDKEIRQSIQNYFNCGPVEERADFYAINIYRWCGNASFKSSGYNLLVKDLKSSDVPTFLSEYGCNTPRSRTFDEVISIYGKDMDKVLSGGVAFEYSEESNSYGIVDLKENQITEREDFSKLAEKLIKVKPRGINIKKYNPKPKQ